MDPIGAPFNEFGPNEDSRRSPDKTPTKFIDAIITSKPYNA